MTAYAICSQVCEVYNFNTETAAFPGKVVPRGWGERMDRGELTRVKRVASRRKTGVQRARGLSPVHFLIQLEIISSIEIISENVLKYFTRSNHFKINS